MTERLYDTDAYLSEFTARVLDCVPAANGYDTVLDRTSFFPEGGGQYGDFGTIDGISVTDTQIKEGVIYHRTDAPLTVGQTVAGKVDFAERFRRMQNHSGEHIVSGIVHRLYGYENVGFHLGDSEMTVDYSGELTAADLRKIERLANRAVWENRRIICGYPSPEELETLEYRSKKELDGAIRIVSVDGIDTCACCAPHVRNTGEIGGIVIVDSLRWKGGVRLHVKCGKDALDEYAALRYDEAQLSALFSAPRGQIFPAAEKLQKEYADLRRLYGQILKENVLLHLEKLPIFEDNFCFLLPTEDGDAMRAAANEGVKKCSGVFVCLSGNDADGYRYVIASSQPGLRAKVKEINAALSGRGGGSDTMIQGSFAATEAQIREYFKEFTI